MTLKSFTIPRSPKDKFKSITKLLEFVEDNINWKHHLDKFVEKGIHGINFGFKESGNTVFIYKYPDYYLVKCLRYPTQLKAVLLKFKTYINLNPKNFKTGVSTPNITCVISAKTNIQNISFKTLVPLIPLYFATSNPPKMVRSISTFASGPIRPKES